LSGIEIELGKATSAARQSVTIKKHLAAIKTHASKTVSMHLGTAPRDDIDLM